MVEDQIPELHPEKKSNNTLIIASIFVAMIVIVSVVLVIALGIIPIGQNEQNGNKILVLASSYDNITSSEAYVLMTDGNAIIVDSRTCPCNYDSEHIGDNDTGEILYEAYCVTCGESKEYSVSKLDILNLTGDIIVYDNDGADTANSYCEELLWNTYAKVHVLEGGFIDWKSKGYPTIIPS